MQAQRTKDAWAVLSWHAAVVAAALWEATANANAKPEIVPPRSTRGHAHHGCAEMQVPWKWWDTRLAGDQRAAS
jgi:hypothetical protein